MLSFLSKNNFGSFVLGLTHHNTREERIEKCIPKILTRKGLNDGYTSKKK